MAARRQLPPLNGLKAFEAAARHLHFERAGEELGVTAGAIAQQVKQLEAWLGLGLFDRRPSRGVSLTPAGRRYAGTLTEMFEGLETATVQLKRRERGASTLTVSTISSFAVAWLIPRLGSLMRRHPEIDVRVQVSVARTDFSREDVDVAVRYALSDSYPGLATHHLFGETFFPVCAASLLDDPDRPLRSPLDLRHHTLIHEVNDPGVPDAVDWPRWLAAAGVPEGAVDASHGPRFPHTFLTLQAATAGQGVALAIPELVEAELAAGRLVKPFGPEVTGPYRYLLVYPEAEADRPSVAAFRRWILEEVGRG